MATSKIATRDVLSEARRRISIRLLVKGAWEFARRKPLGAASAIIIMLVIVVGVFAPLIGRYDPLSTNLRELLAGPSAGHWFGTDHLGRDVYARIVHGTRSALYVGVLSVILAISVGTTLGLLSGYLGGKFDLLVQRAIDSIMAFPPLILALAVASILGPSNTNSLFIIALLLTPNATRIARGATLSLRTRPYIEASIALGAQTPRIISRHILPNILAPMIIILSVDLGAALLVAASLSFLGVGQPEPSPSWGLMLAGQGRSYLEVAPWMAIAPAIAISLSVLSFNLLGDALRDILDPRLRGAGGRVR